VAQPLRGGDLVGVIGDQERVAAGPGGCGGGHQNCHMHCVGNRPAEGVSALVAIDVHHMNGFLSVPHATVGPRADRRAVERTTNDGQRRMVRRPIWLDRRAMSLDRLPSSVGA
jgi:hypothetical protein